MTGIPSIDVTLDGKTVRLTRQEAYNLAKMLTRTVSAAIDRK